MKTGFIVNKLAPGSNDAWIPKWPSGLEERMHRIKRNDVEATLLETLEDAITVKTIFASGTGGVFGIEEILLDNK